LKVRIATKGSRTYQDIKKAVRRVLYYNQIIRTSDRIYYRLINAAKYSIPALRNDYTLQQLEGIVQDEWNTMNGVGAKC